MSKKVTCIKKCFYKGSLYTPGDVITLPADVKDVPKHFTDGKVAIKKPVAVEDPKTLHELAKSKARMADEGLGKALE
jgi:hypothetical protein